LVEDEDDDESFFQRHRLAFIAGGIVLIGAAWGVLHKPSGKSEPVRKAPEQQMVRIQLPPPPPPPPPPKVQPPPPRDDKRVEQAPSAKPEPKPEAPKPAEKPPEGLGTNNKGPGPGMAGLGSSGNGMIGGTGTGSGGGGGSMARWYAGQVQTKIAEAMRNNRKTRAASLRLEVQLWVDPSGRVTRAALGSSTGDASLDEALKKEVLAGIQLAEPPPKGMRMPISLRLTARRPN
jgi:TonB family protein